MKISTLFLSIVLIIGASAAALSEERADSFDLLGKAPAVVGSQKFDGKPGSPLVVTFFASWCPPCTSEFINLNAALTELTVKNAPAVNFVAVNLFENFGGSENPARMERFISRTKPKFPLIEGNQAISEAFGTIERIPTVVILDGAGEEIWRFVHERGATKTHVTTSEILEQLAGLTH